MKLNKIYTRTGDDGSTGLVDGSRVSKAGARIEAIGAVDEANSAIGVAAALLEGDDRAMLSRIQNDLFDLGADIATPAEDDGDFTPSEMRLRIVAAQPSRLEAEIDAMNAGLEPLRSFVLPGGTPAAAALHVARASIRRAERAMVAARADGPLNPQALILINRISDHLFVMARMVNHRAAGDVLWVPGASR